MALGDSHVLQQVKVQVPEPSFCNLTASTNGLPTASGLTPSGLCCANPELNAQIEVAENESVRNRPYRHAPIPLTRSADISFDLYVRGNGSNDSIIFTDTMFDILKLCFPIVTTNARESAVASWDTTTQITLSSGEGANWGVGQGFYAIANGKCYVSFIKAIAGDVVTIGPAVPASVVTAAPANIRGGRTYAMGSGHADGVTGYMEFLHESYKGRAWGVVGESLEIPLETGKAAVANVNLVAAYADYATAVQPGATAEPNGEWLKFLNGICLMNGSNREVRSCNWQFAFNPVVVPDPNNGVGAAKWGSGEPEVTADVELSAWDGGTLFTAFENGTHFELLTVLQAGAEGEVAAIYVPQMHVAEAPTPGEADGLTTLPVKLRSGLYEGDTGSYDSATLVDTTARLFFGW